MNSLETKIHQAIHEGDGTMTIYNVTKYECPTCKSAMFISKRGGGELTCPSCSYTCEQCLIKPLFTPEMKVPVWKWLSNTEKTLEELRSLVPK